MLLKVAANICRGNSSEWLSGSHRGATLSVTCAADLNKIILVKILSISYNVK